MKDYYKILQVERNSKLITIRKSYRKLALLIHPDINKEPSAHEKFVELNEAYQVLKNPIRKIHYDQLYDEYYLNKPPKNLSKYQKHKEAWTSNINNAATKGYKKGGKYASEESSKFKKRCKTNSYADAFSSIFELIATILEIIGSFV